MYQIILHSPNFGLILTLLVTTHSITTLPWIKLQGNALGAPNLGDVMQ